MIMTVFIPINTCMECPHLKIERTIGAGYAHDYICKAKKNGNNKIAVYVEYPSEEPKVIPDWCPFKNKIDFL